MNDLIFQQMFDTVYSVIPEKWNKVIIYAEYGENSHSVNFYVNTEGRYIDSYNLPGVGEKDRYRIFDEIDSVLRPERRKADSNMKWTVLTLIVDNEGRMKADFVYDDISENSIEFKMNWRKNYLK